MPDIKYSEAHNKDASRPVKDTDIIGITTSDTDPNQGITLLQLKEYING